MLLEMAVISGFAITALYKPISEYLSKDISKAEIKNHHELSDMKGDGLILSKHVRLSVPYSNEHILVIAPSGAGKSRKVVMPNVNTLKKCTMIVADPSGEIEKECKTDKKSLKLNPLSDDSIGYCPLKNAKSSSEVKKLAQIILTNGAMSTQMMSGSKSSDKHGEWLNMCTPLLSAYMLMNWRKKKYSFPKMIINLMTKPLVPREDDKGNSIYEEIMDSDVFEAIIEIRSFLQVMGSPQTLSSIRNVLNSNLQIFTDENVFNLMSKSSIKLDYLRKNETILYIQIPEKDSEYYSPLSALFISQMLDHVIEDNNGLQTYFLLDELCNIGYIPGLCKLLSTCRKRNISIVGCIQSLAQFQRVYGDAQAKELIELFKTLIVMGGLKDTAEYIEKLMGNKEVTKDNQFIYTKPILTADEIRRLDKKKALILCHNKQPVIDDLY